MDSYKSSPRAHLRIPQKAFQWARARRLTLVAIISTLLLIALFRVHPLYSVEVSLLISFQHGYTSGSSIPPYHSSSSSDKIPRIHLLVPDNKPDANLCKNILTARINRYPTPHILNWGAEFEGEASAFGTHVAKLTVVNKYLSSLPESADSDLVLLVDAFDIWFQLPLRVLLSRYHAINRRANARILKQVGSKRMKEEGVRQSIVVSTQKRCWPGDTAEPWCYAVPQSPLPRDLYGEDTDRDITVWDDDTFKFARFRPRFVNSGIVMGKVGDMKKLYTRLNELWHTEMEGEVHDQAILARIFGSQEYQRRIWQDELNWEKEQQRSSWLPKVMSKDGEKSGLRNSSYGDNHPTRRRPDLEEGKTYQFAMGLDYWSEIGVPTVFSDFDYEWIRWNDTSALHLAWEDHNVTNPLRDSLDDDIIDAAPPFVSLDDAVNTESEGGGGWASQSLFSNLWTGVTPAIVHHNAHRNGLKANREKMWPSLWLQPHARELIAERVAEPSSGKEYANNVGNDEIMTGLSFGAYTDKPGAESLSWGQLCDEDMQEEVFRDGKGVLKLGG